MKMLCIFFWALMLMMLNGCGSDSSSTSKSGNNNENPITMKKDVSQEQGRIRFRVSNTNGVSVLSANEATGKLIATTDKLQLAIDSALTIKEENIKEVSSGVYEISNVPVSTDAAITFVDDKGNGFELDNIIVDDNKTTDLGTLDVNNTFDLNVSIVSNVFSEVLININSLNFAKKVKCNNPLSINKIPKGNYFISISDINGNIIISKYAQLDDDNLFVKFDLDSNVFTGELSGILEDTNGRALANASVYLKPSRENYLFALTEDDGSFKFKHLPKGKYTIKIQKKGYKPKIIQDVSLGSKSVDLGVLDLDFENKLGSISGYVYFSDAQEHAGIDITVERIDGVFETKQNGSLKDGAFLITDLPSGKYKLHFGKSSDSIYQQVSTAELNVLGGVTTTLEASHILTKLVATVKGSVYLPSSVTDTSKISVKIQDVNGQDIGTSGLVYTADGNGTKLYGYNITVPIGDNYKLIITGTDQDGNALQSYTQDLGTLEAGIDVEIFDVLVGYIDKNPPIFKGYSIINLSDKTKKDTNGNYYINPNNEVVLETVAQDADGDSIQYLFSSKDGSFSEIDEVKGKAHYIAPNLGGTVNLSVTAKSGSREAVENILIHVNHRPSITVSDTNLLDKNNPKIFNSSDIITIASSVSDVEDQDLNISWKSDIQGDLNVSKSLLKDILIPGTHEITETVKDSFGLYTQQHYYVKVLSAGMVWLKAPNNGTTKIYQINQTLTDSYQIEIGGIEGGLNYASLDTSVATVDGNGLVLSVAAGSTKIKISSMDTDTDGNPLYTIHLAIRVVDKLKNQDLTTFKLKPGAVMQFEVANSSSLMQADGYIHIPFESLYEGAYEVVLFDQKDIVVNSISDAVIYIDDTQSGYIKSGIKKTRFSFEVIDVSKSYELRVKPHSSDGDEYIKVALVPGNDLKDTNGKLLSSIIRDDRYEFNDIAETAARINLDNVIYSTVNYLDFDIVDWYEVELSRGKSTIDLTLIDADGYFYLQVFDPSGQKIVDKSVYGRDGTNLKEEIDATSAGSYKIYFYSNYVTSYKFKVEPSLANGLVQDSITYEQNDWGFNAYPIAINKTIVSSLNRIKNDRTDWYKVDLSNGKSTIDLTLIDADGYFYLQVFDPSGQKIVDKSVYGRDGTNLKEEIDATSAGSYKIYFYSNYVTSYKFIID